MGLTKEGRRLLQLEKEHEELCNSESKFWREVADKMWHHDFDMGAIGYSITIEDLEGILAKIFDGFPGDAKGDTAIEASRLLIKNIAIWLKETFGFIYKRG